MSIEAAAAFKALVDQDPALRAEALAAYQAGGLTAVAGLAAGRGHQFAPTDAVAVLTTAATAGELSDLELQAVAGGVGKAPRGTPVGSQLRPGFGLLHGVGQVSFRIF